MNKDNIPSTILLDDVLLKESTHEINYHTFELIKTVKNFISYSINHDDKDNFINILPLYACSDLWKIEYNILFKNMPIAIQPSEDFFERYEFKINNMILQYIKDDNAISRIFKNGDVSKNRLIQVIHPDYMFKEKTNKENYSLKRLSPNSKITKKQFVKDTEELLVCLKTGKKKYNDILLLLNNHLSSDEFHYFIKCNIENKPLLYLLLLVAESNIQTILINEFSKNNIEISYDILTVFFNQFKIGEEGNSSLGWIKQQQNKLLDTLKDGSVLNTLLLNHKMEKELLEKKETKNKIKI